MIELSSVGTGTSARCCAHHPEARHRRPAEFGAYDNPTWRGMAYFFRDVTMYVALLVVLVFISDIVSAVAALEVVMALVVSGLFVVGHDAAHRSSSSRSAWKANTTVAHLAFLRLPRLRGLDPRL